MKPININNVPTEYLLRTKAGNLWRCGKGYRKDWNKLIGEFVLIHNTAYTLKDRIKKAGKWYLVFDDGRYNYTERQDKALKNKKLSRDVIKETDFSKGLFNKLPNGKIVLKDKFNKYTKVPKQTEQQLLLPAPMELIDRLVQEMQIRSKEYNKLFKEKYGKRKKKGLLPLAPQCNDFDCKIMYLSLSNVISKNLYNSYYKQLVHYYHPDKGNVQNMDYINDILFLYK